MSKDIIWLMVMTPERLVDKIDFFMHQDIHRVPSTLSMTMTMTFRMYDAYDLQ
jgi:hypothetical protein